MIAQPRLFDSPDPEHVLARHAPVVLEPDNTETVPGMDEADWPEYLRVVGWHDTDEFGDVRCVDVETGGLL